MNAEECRFRADVRRRGEREYACCTLLQTITGIDRPDLCEVPRDACEACCRLYPPSPTSLNAVVASNLYLVARDIIEQGGMRGCDVGKAAGIQAWAVLNLDTIKYVCPIDYAALRAKGVARECCHLGEEIPPSTEAEKTRETAYRCDHPAHGRTTASECYRCRDWASEPAERPPVLPTLRRVPVEGEGRAFTRWAVGVTTAQRGRPTLAWCLDSVIRAGWEEPHVFMDSPVDLADRHRNLPVSVRKKRIGAWPSYHLAVLELLLSHPEADAYLLVQDDVVFHDRENLREYLESLIWPHDVGVVSLYSSRAYTQAEPGWYLLPRTWVWGALAFIFSRERAKEFVSDRRVLRHRWNTWNNGRANIDSVIGRWASRGKLTTYYPSPSLAQHIGEMSTIWRWTRASGHRRADRFAGDE